MNKGLHLMHVFPGFAPGGAELRMTRIMNGMGPGVRHTVLSLNGYWGARDSIDAEIPTEYVTAPPGGGGRFYFLELQSAIRRRHPDVLLTYNWGAIEATIGGWLGNICPIIHNECGFGADESAGFKTSRVLTRWIVLNQVFAVAVTSRAMREVATRVFRLPAEKVHWIRTGVDVERFRPGLSRDWRREIGVGDDELLAGFLGGFRPEKNLPLLIRAFASARIPKAKLALVGDGFGGEQLRRLVGELRCEDSVIFAGHAADPVACLAALDVFALSSCTEQTSNALLEAMACGLPAVATDVGDSADLLGAEYVVPSGDECEFALALAALAESAELRCRMGAANRRRCVERHPLAGMVHQYEALYRAAAASGRSGA